MRNSLSLGGTLISYIEPNNMNVNAWCRPTQFLEEKKRRKIQGLSPYHEIESRAVVWMFKVFKAVYIFY